MTIVARPVVPVGTAEFVTDPQRTFNRAGWVVWHRVPESGEDTLVNVVGYQAYLVFVDSNALGGGATSLALDVTGEARFHRPTWTPGRYHLTGLNLAEPATMGALFGSDGVAGGAHPVHLAFRLNAEGNWNPVRASDLIQPGEALWIFAEKRSDFMGPVSVTFDGTRSLDFGRGPGTVEVADGDDSLLASLRTLHFFNRDGSPHPLRIRQIDADDTQATGADDLRILQVVPVPDQLQHEVGPQGEFEDWDLGELPSSTALTVTLGAHRTWDTGPAAREKLYRIDVGSQFFYLPVSASQQTSSLSLGSAEPPLLGADDLTTASGFGGLWAGVVVFDSVTRLQAVAPASTATTSTVPMRVLVHVDDGGGAVLLNHVTVMQQNGEQVLVVDDSKIPFYEGIETRNGKSVGLRMTSIGYDMPRDWSPTAQAGLVDSVAAADGVDPADVTAEQINIWVDGRSERPSALAETYATAWPLDGTLDATLSSSAPLQLDPFHRSNPFRHAFHPRHGTGLAITRAITIAIDDSSEVGVVEGTYQETITGLADDPVTLSGNVVLQRISTVTSLQ